MIKYTPNANIDTQHEMAHKATDTRPRIRAVVSVAFHQMTPSNLSFEPRSVG